MKDLPKFAAPSGEVFEHYKTDIGDAFAAASQGRA
jgi:hypothetical protein